MDKISQIQQQNNLEYVFENLDLLKETCPLHEGNKFDYLCINSSQQECVFKCMFCVTDEDVKQYSLIPLKQVASAQDKTIFANFPLTDRTLTKKIKEITQKPPTSEALKLQIESFFKELSATIFNKLESVQANMITKSQSISNLSGEILSMYNTMSEKEILKQILADSSKPSATDKSSDIKALCSRVLSKDQENQSAIKAALEKAEILEKAIDFKTPEQIKDRILLQIEKIDMFLIEDIGKFSEQLKEQNNHFDANQTVENLMKLVKNKFNGVSEESCLKFEGQLNRMAFALSSLEVPIPGTQYEHLYSLTENQTNEIARLVESLSKLNQEIDNKQMNIEEKEKLKSDELFDLISNQTNFCSNEYLHDTKCVFEVIRGVLGLFRTRKLNERTQEQKAFNRLNKDQLKNLARLAAKVNELTDKSGDQYLLSNKPQGQIQSNSANLIEYLRHSRFGKMSDEEQKNIRRDLHQLLVNYPIFETLTAIQIKREYQPMTFTKSPHGSSSEMIITQNGNEVELTLGASKQGQCNSQILDSNRGYSLKLTFNRPFGQAKSGNFRIGLHQNKQIPSHYIPASTHESCFYSSLNNGAKSTILGGKLTSEGLRNTTSSLEFRWCVTKRQFFISDLTYSNINQAEENHFTPTEQYCFSVCFACLAESDWKVTISEFQEIDSNEVANFD